MEARFNIEARVRRARGRVRVTLLHNGRIVYTAGLTGLSAAEAERLEQEQRTALSGLGIAVA